MRIGPHFGCFGVCLPAHNLLLNSKSMLAVAIATIFEVKSKGFPPVRRPVKASHEKG